MGTPVPNRAVEEACRGAGPLTVTTIDRLDPATRDELIRKYGLQIGEPSGGEADKVKETSNEKQAGSDTLTKEKYLELSGQLPDYKIANQFNISTQALKRRKEEWGIPDRRLNPAKPARSTTEKPGRPDSVSAAEKKAFQEELIISTEQQSTNNEQLAHLPEKILQLEMSLKKRDEEIAVLQAENEKLRDSYEQLIKEIQDASFHTLSKLLDGVLQFSIITKNEETADVARRTLQQIGLDLDYKVRSGVIEVTTAV